MAIGGELTTNVSDTWLLELMGSLGRLVVAVILYVEPATALKVPFKVKFSCSSGSRVGIYVWLMVVTILPGAVTATVTGILLIGLRPKFFRLTVTCVAPGHVPVKPGETIAVIPASVLVCKN